MAVEEHDEPAGRRSPRGAVTSSPAVRRSPSTARRSTRPSARASSSSGRKERRGAACRGRRNDGARDRRRRAAQAFEVSPWEFAFSAVRRVRGEAVRRGEAVLLPKGSRRPIARREPSLLCTKSPASRKNVAGTYSRRGVLSIALGAVARYRQRVERQRDDDARSRLQPHDLARDDRRWDRSIRRRRAGACRRHECPQRGNRIGRRLRDEQHGAVAVADKRVDEQLQAERERERLVRVLAAEGHELVLRRGACE